MKRDLHKTRWRINEDYLYTGNCRFTEMLYQLNRYVDKSPDAKAWRLLMNIQIFLSQRFEYEERLMDACQDEALSAHRQQHELMLRQLDWSLKMVRKDNRIDRDLCDFLGDWFTFHTKHLDRLLAADI